MTRVLVVDDHPVFRRGLAGLLDVAGFEVVAEAASGSEAIALTERLLPDLVVMDLGLPDLSGVDGTAAITGAHPGVRVLVVTMFDDDGTVRQALAAGATGYVVKDAGHEEIVAAARAAVLGATVLGRGVRVPASASSCISTAERYGLSPREAQVADLLARGLANRQIAERLGIAGKTVSNLVSSVLAKLGVGDRVEAALVLRAES